MIALLYPHLFVPLQPQICRSAEPSPIFLLKKLHTVPAFAMKAGAVVFGWNQQKGLNNQTLFHESFLLLYEILLLVG